MKFAMKVIEKSKLKDKNSINRLLKEIEIQNDLDHDRIVKLYKFFEDNNYV